MKTTTTETKRRAAAFSAMWTDARYLRLQAKKDDALRAERMGEFYGLPADRMARLKASATRAIRALGRFEDLYIASR